MAVEPFGEIIRRLRTQQRWSQEHLADAAGVSQSAVSKAEGAEALSSAGRIDTVAKILRALGVTDMKDVGLDFDESDWPGPLFVSSREGPGRHDPAPSLVAFRDAIKWSFDPRVHELEDIETTTRMAGGLGALVNQFDQDMLQAIARVWLDTAAILRKYRLPHPSDSMFAVVLGALVVAARDSADEYARVLDNLERGVDRNGAPIADVQTLQKALFLHPIHMPDMKELRFSRSERAKRNQSRSTPDEPPWMPASAEPSRPNVSHVPTPPKAMTATARGLADNVTAYQKAGDETPRRGLAPNDHQESPAVSSQEWGSPERQPSPENNEPPRKARRVILDDFTVPMEKLQRDTAPPFVHVPTPPGATPAARPKTVAPTEREIFETPEKPADAKSASKKPAVHILRKPYPKTNS